MLSTQEAVKVARKAYPSGKIQAYVEYKNLYLFKIFNSNPGEEEMDPFFSVNKETGEFKEFSLFTDGDITEVITLFKNAERR